MVDNSTTRNGLCRSSTHGRFVEGVPMRQNGKRHGMWPPTRPGRCWSNHPFDPSAQPRCGCCEHPPHTRGSAGNGATPGFMTQRLWRCGGGDRKWTRMGRGRVEGVVVGSGRCRISLRDAVVMWGHTGGVVALLLNHRLQSGNPPGSGRGIPAPPARFPGCFFTPFESAPASLCPHVVRPRCHSSSLPSVV